MNSDLSLSNPRLAQHSLNLTLDNKLILGMGFIFFLRTILYTMILSNGNKTNKYTLSIRLKIM